MTQAHLHSTEQELRTTSDEMDASRKQHDHQRIKLLGLNS